MYANKNEGFVKKVAFFLAHVEKLLYLCSVE